MIQLTKEQENFILKNWQQIDFLSLVQEVFKNPKLNGRSKEAKIVQKFLGDRKLKKEIDADNILSDSQKEFVDKNIDSLTSLEIAKIIFGNQKLEPLSKEVQMIDDYVKKLEKDIKTFPHEDYATEEYKAPDQLSAVVTKVNAYLRKDLSLKTMPTIQRKSMEAIRNFLHAPRFLQSINSYASQKTRDMFEGEFIRSVFDKPDLIPDELNLVITLCQYYVIGVTLHRHLDLLNLRYEETLNDPDSKGLQSLAEMIKAKSTELKECNKAQADLVKALSGERSKRQEKNAGSQASLARLVEWFREAEERKKALERARIQEQEDEIEVKRLEEISETKARILGISKSEMLHG